MAGLPTTKKTSLIEIDARPNLLYVKFIGPQVGQRESPIISAEVEPYIKEYGKALEHFVIDMQGVTFMSSMGLGVCIALRHKANTAGAKAILYGTSPDLLKLFAMMKIDQLYKFAKDQGELDKLLR